MRFLTSVGSPRCEVCDACAKPVAPSDVLYRIYGAGYRHFHFHRACFSIWGECTLTLASLRKRTDWNLSAPKRRLGCRAVRDRPGRPAGHAVDQMPDQREQRHQRAIFRHVRAPHRIRCLGIAQIPQ
jgi:hypothetical protein